jgi:hypothetical protein
MEAFTLSSSGEYWTVVHAAEDDPIWDVIFKAYEDWCKSVWYNPVFFYAPLLAATL